MSAGFSVSLNFSSPTQTADFARSVLSILGPGDVLLLSGSIGAGKTHFARALIQSALAEHDLVEDVPSPTFTLVQTYEAGTLEIWHADLYRLTHPDEVSELGLDEAFETALCLVEWPDRLGDLAPQSALSLSFATTGDEARTLTIQGADHWKTRLQEVLT